MKVGIVGYGSIGQRHARNLTALGHQTLIYDPAGQRDVSFERNIYETCEAVVIATPTWVHTGGIRGCAERGRHMLVEKPISINDGNLQSLLDLAESKKIVVMMGNNLRFHPCVQQAKAWITLGHIGQPLWANFICSSLSEKAPYLSDGVILNTGAHEVDLALHFFGPARVISASARLSEHGDDIADFVLRHENGVRSSFHLDFVTPNEIREFWIAGDDKNIGVNLPERRICMGKMIQGSAGSYDDDYLDELRAFIDRIEGRNVPGATGAEGLATLKILLEIRKMAGLA